ncbi:protein ACCELERATED CELL DEATH 6-like [Spinacia oleracea]|uniref:Protein ACCELERATED CELL DEATH 6-like n=1 Tax=Spinacia oleracea TaxID=3562 RepID=A0A9R0HWT9_SPIOL|nr:protein ACCELERATED CELL DEATH 6-like [Spinacia oleracea]
MDDIEFGTWLVEEAPKFITEKDKNGQSPWDKAYEIGPAWFINAVLIKDPTVFSSTPLVWIKACEKGHVSALQAFVDHNPGKFRDLCIKHKDSPLHHIKLHESLTEYEKFLKIEHMKDLINLQDSKGATPLHKAIRNGDLLLTESLLNMEKIIYDIEDDEKLSAMDLLAEECDESSEDKHTWDRMCKRFGLDPTINTTYFKSKTNLLDVRSSLFIVAALLATITFTAGFTLPGGFNQETGAALLGNKAIFLVFLISDALALFFSMMVLISLTWSMVYEASKSLVLIDRSMVLLRISLNCTLVAFVSGVYTVLAPMTLWAAILIVVIITALIGISLHKTLFYNVLEKLTPSPKKKVRSRKRDQTPAGKSGISDEKEQLLSDSGENSTKDPETGSHTTNEDLDAIV